MFSSFLLCVTNDLYELKKKQQTTDRSYQCQMEAVICRARVAICNLQQTAAQLHGEEEEVKSTRISSPFKFY